MFICFAGVCLTWPILLPINANGGGSASQLDRLGFGNVRQQSLLYAHAVIAWAYFAFVMYVVARERLWLIGLRQAQRLSKYNASKLSSRTVLYLDPPEGTALDADAKSNFGENAKRQWIIAPAKEVGSAVSSRDSRVADLESAQVTFLKRAWKTREKRANRGQSTTLSEQTLNGLRPRKRKYYVVGESSDKIDDLRTDIKEAAQTVDERRESHSGTSSLSRSAIFVEYATQTVAQRAYQGEPIPQLFKGAKLPIKTRLVGVPPNEVLWDNLVKPQAARISEKSGATIFIALLIVFWSIPTTFIGTISNIDYLTGKVEWLRWINDLPAPILGALKGFLPPFLTSWLSSYLPKFMRSMYSFNHSVLGHTLTLVMQRSRGGLDTQRPFPPSYRFRLGTMRSS
jgi:calcium permeable stress-gated cation channel